MLKILLSPRFLSMKHGLNRKDILRRLPLMLVGLGFWIFLYWATSQILIFVRGVPLLGDTLAERLFSLIFFSLTGFLILSNVITSLSSFYLSRDLPFLLSKPVPVGEIIRLKTIETVLNSSWMVVSFIPPVLISFGLVYRVSPSYYIVLSLVFIFFIILTAGIGISISHILTRVIPARQMVNIFLGAGLVLFVLFYFLLKSLIPESADSTTDLLQSFSSLKADFPLLPGHWIAETIRPFLKKNSPGPFYLLVLLSNAAFFLVLSHSLGMRFYRSNLERIQPSRKAAADLHSRRYYPSALAALPYKDLKVFFRDTAQWSQILIICSLIMVYVYNFRTIPVASVTTLIPYARELMVLVNMLLAGLVLSAVAARFMYVSVSLEGQAFWVIKASPLPMKRFLRTKFLIGVFPVTILMLILVFLTNIVLDVGPALMILSLLTVVLLSFSVGGLGTGYGAVFPDFRYENINAVSMSINAMIFMVIAFSIVITTLSLEAMIGYILYKSGNMKGMGFQDMLQVSICLVLILTINAAAFIIPMRKGLKKLSDMQL